MKLQFISHNKIRPNENPRKTFKGIDELRENIKAIGITTPLIVDPEYHLLDGERRWRASKGVLKELPCVIIDNKDWQKADKRLEIQISIDAMSEEWNVIDRAEAWKRYLDLGHTAIELSKILGHKNSSTVLDTLSLLNTPRRVFDKLRQDPTNWTWHRDVETQGGKLPDKQRAIIHQRIFDGAYNSQDDLNESLKLAVDNPGLVEKLVKATTPLERKMVEFGEQYKQERVNRQYENRGLTQEQKEQKIVFALLSSLNQINMARLLWERTDAIDLLKKHLKKEDFPKIIKQIQTIIKAWNKTLEELE
ncbi:MAG: ParB N-terminal domain-containing protein [Nanoarchaeota archaeon]